MSVANINTLIQNLRSQTAVNSVSPDSLGSILQAITDEIERTAGLVHNAQSGMFWFGKIKGATIEGATETELVAEDVDYRTVDSCIEISYEEGPIIRATRECIVHVTGQIGLQPIGSYASDRVLRWFKLDSDGERYADSIMTTHFTGTTQIFNVPIDYSCILFEGQTLHLVAYCSSAHQTQVSENSRLNIQAYLI